MRLLILENNGDIPISYLDFSYLKNNKLQNIHVK